MKQKLKKLILPALALAIFLPLISMAASDETSIPEQAKNKFERKQELAKNYNYSLSDREANLLERENRRLENRAKHTEMMNILETGDFNAWLEFAEDKNCPNISEMTEENFSEFIEKHKLKVENRGSEAKELNQRKQNNFKLINGR